MNNKILVTTILFLLIAFNLSSAENKFSFRVDLSSWVASDYRPVVSKNYPNLQPEEGSYSIADNLIDDHKYHYAGIRPALEYNFSKRIMVGLSLGIFYEVKDGINYIDASTSRADTQQNDSSVTVYDINHVDNRNYIFLWGLKIDYKISDKIGFTSSLDYHSSKLYSERPSRHIYTRLTGKYRIHRYFSLDAGAEYYWIENEPDYGVTRSTYFSDFYLSRESLSEKNYKYNRYFGFVFGGGFDYPINERMSFVGDMRYSFAYGDYFIFSSGIKYDL